MKHTIAGIAAALAALVAPAAGAQSIAWTHRIHGSTDPGAPADYYPDVRLAQNRPLMAWTPAATPGIVTVGELGALRALIGKVAASDGAELWRRDLGDDVVAETSFSDVAVDRSGDVLATGGRFSSDGGAWRTSWYAVKVSGATGQTQWERHWLPAGSIGGALLALAMTANGDAVAFGSRENDTNPFSYVVRLSGSNGGTPVWTTAIPFDVGLGPVLVATDAADNTFAVPGSAALVKIASDGALAWSADLAPRLEFACARIRDVAVEPASGDAIVAGRAGCAAPQTGFVARIGSATGDVIWTATGLGSTDASDVAALALGATGTVVAAGGRTSGTDTRWFAALLSLADGTVAWTAPGGETSRDVPTDVAIGLDGDVLLTGICDGNAFCVARLDSGTGARRWSLQTGAAYTASTENYPNTILSTGGGVFFGGKDTSAGATTWTVHRIDPTLSDAIYANGFE